MHDRQRVALLTSALITATGIALAQTSGQQPPGGGGQAPSTNGPVDRDMDLPVERPPKKAPAKAPPAPPPPETPITPPPPTIYGRSIPSENASLCYVVDVSGSMGWDIGQYTGADGKTAMGPRLARAKAELERSVASLPKNFKFTLLAFDCSVYAWLPTLTDASPGNKASALAWIEGLHELGATGTGPAVTMGLAIGGVKMVVLLTDGAPNCGAGDGWGDAACIREHRLMIRRNNKRNATVHVFGIGATGDFKQFCMDVAADNGGTYTDVR